MWMIVIEGTKTDLTWSGPFFRSCLYLVRLFSTYDITMHMIPSVEKIFPQDIYLLGAILSDKLSKKRRRTSPSFSTNLQFILSPPSLLPIRPRNRFDSYAIYHRASIKELPDALDWFPIEVGRAIGTLEQRCYRLLRSRCPNGTNFPWKTGGGRCATNGWS